MPNTILGTLLVVSHLTFTTLLKARYYRYLQIEMRKKKTGGLKYS